MGPGALIVNTNVTLEDIHIHDISSGTWKDISIHLNGDILNESIHAWFHLHEFETEFNHHSQPNEAPKACGIMTNCCTIESAN